MNHKPVLGVLAAATAALLITACGGQAPTAGAPSATPAAATGGSAALSAVHNPADVTFAQQMIPHHQQAVDMAKLAADHAASSDVKQLAARIQAAQDPEIAQMRGFLATWGVRAQTSNGDMSGSHDMGGTAAAGMPGMMSTAHMNELNHATGAAFDKRSCR